MKLQALLGIIGLSVIYGHRSGSNEAQSSRYAFKEEFHWTLPEFKFPSASARSVALSTGSYIPENNCVYAIGIWKDKIFVSVFRLKLGIASTFNVFSKNSANKSPVLIPYPSYEANYVNEDPNHRTVSLPSSASLINVAYFRVEKCDRLWIVDSGVVDFFKTRRVVSPPSLVIFDLKTNKLIRRYIIPAALCDSNTGFVHVEVDLSNGCNDAYAYMVDIFRSIVVYSFKKDRSWRLTHNYFGSEPHGGNFFYEGVTFHWNFGVVGTTLGEHHHDGSRRVYIKPFSSTKTYYISNKVLQDENYIAQNNYFYDVHLLGDRGHKGHIYEYAYDEKSNVLFDTQFDRKRIGCWNTATPYQSSSFDAVYETSKRFFPVAVTVDRNRNVWVVTNDFPLYFYGPWNPNARNMRIYKAKVDDLISETICKFR